MKTPRKLYLVVSKSVKTIRSPGHENDPHELALTTFAEAKRVRSTRNEAKFHGAVDWRIETYVKGD